MPGPEDIELDLSGPAARLIVSAVERRKAAQGAIFAIPVGQDGALGAPRALEVVGRDDTPFVPHGISLVGEAKPRLYVINHIARDRHAVEVFRLDGERLAFVDRLTSPLLTTPNDLVTLADGQIYVTNTGRTSGIAGALALLLVRRLGSVVHHKDGRWTEVATGIAFANGIALAPDGGALYVAGTRDKALYVFRRDPRTGTLGAESRTIVIGSGVDNLTWTDGNTLVLAAHPSLFPFVLHASGVRQRSPSEVYRVDVSGARAPELVFADDGTRVSAASTAILWRDRLYMGQVFSPGVIACSLTAVSGGDHGLGHRRVPRMPDGLRRRQGPGRQPGCRGPVPRPDHRGRTARLSPGRPRRRRAAVAGGRGGEHERARPAPRRLLEGLAVRPLAVLVLTLLVVGCATPVNRNLETINDKKGYRYDALSKEGNGDELFVILAFSGGGTRAAAFSYGVMEALNDARRANGRALLADVDVISSVSGGSFTAAYYALFREAMFTESGRATFLHEKIQFQNVLIARALWPPNWFRLLSPGFGRINLAAEFYDEKIFGGKTFADLMGRKPYIILNATDMSLGQRFEFTQDQFDLLCSDLASVKIATGVAASSAFPGLLSPLTVESFAAEGCKYKEPLWLTEAKKRPGNPARRWARARDLASYQDAKDERTFIHLLDGGLADNIGLRGPYTALTSNDSGWSLLERINQGRVDRVLVITANAKTKHRTTWDRHRSAPGLLSVLGFVTTGPMDNYSFDSVQLVTDHFDRLRESFQNYTVCQRRLDACGGGALAGVARPVDFHAIEVSFDGFYGSRDADRLRRCLEELPTSFKLSDDQVDLLRQAGYLLLITSGDFTKAMTAIDPAWTPPTAAIDPALVGRACPAGG